MSDKLRELENLYYSLESQMIFLSQGKEYAKAREVCIIINDTLQTMLNYYMQKGVILGAMRSIRAREQIFSCAEKLRILEEGGIQNENPQNVNGSHPC